MISTRPKAQQLAFDFSDEVVSPDAVSELQPEQSVSAAMEKPALDSDSLELMERIVDKGNMERGWKKVKANRRAPGPDGITLDEFFEIFGTSLLHEDESPSADPHARSCERGPGQPGPDLDPIGSVAMTSDSVFKTLEV